MSLLIENLNLPEKDTHLVLIVAQDGSVAASTVATKDEKYVPGTEIKDIKAIQADDMRCVVHAHWIFDDFDGDGKDYQCSHCKSYSRNNSDFCPNCGAIMEG